MVVATIPLFGCSTYTGIIPSQNIKSVKQEYTEAMNKRPREQAFKLEMFQAEVEADIVDSFKIDEKNYKPIRLVDIPDLNYGGIDGLNDPIFCEKAAEVINENVYSAPGGSIKPITFINDKSLIFCFKMSNDGTNYMKKYEYRNSEFIKIEEVSKPSKVLHMNK